MACLGTFQSARAVASFTFEGQPVTGMFQAVGDVNGDGAPDLAVTYDRFYGFNDGWDGDISYAVGSVAVMLGNGDVKSELARMIKEWKADLVVTGSHGHRWLGDLFLGATTSGLRHRVQCPVLTIRASRSQPKS